MLNKNLAMALGALTGLVGLVGMIRLASGAFTHGMSGFAWVVILSAMLPWIGYAAWRGTTDISVSVVRWRYCCWTLSGVWWCGCSCSALCWRWPARLPHSWLSGSAIGRLAVQSSEERFVRIEELRAEDSDQRRGPA